METDVASEPSELALLLAELQEKARKSPPVVLADALPISSITQLPELFQPRGTDERHIQELVSALKRDGMLSPILVMPIGDEIYLLDGHHRMAAYAVARIADPVPIRQFTGTVEEAIVEAGKANSQAKLPMTTQERQNYAWRLVVLGAHSKSQIVAAASVSDGQVALMRRAKGCLGRDADVYPTWARAHSVYKGKTTELPLDADIEAWFEAQAQSYADRLAREFGNKLSANTEVAAKAMHVYFGRKLSDLVGELIGHLTDEEREDLILLKDADFPF